MIWLHEVPDEHQVTLDELL
jgi:hypothetical protein